MRIPDRAIDVGGSLLEGAHRVLLTASGGQFPKRFLGALPLELHTVGRKSGKPYTTLLTSPVNDDHRIVLVASKGGHSKDPDWYKNAVATPDVTITVAGATKPMHARTATPQERTELWPRVVKAYRGYEGYQRNTDRQIPLLILEPR